MQDIIIIGVSGGSASGKTTVASRLKEEFKDSVELICHDYYYRAHNELQYEERSKLNYDHPNAFDTKRLIEDIKELKKGHTIERPVYSYTIHNRLDETVTVYPAKVIILEGFLIFENQDLLDLMDIKIFVDTAADERVIRRILRDVKERGRSLESVIEQYITTVKPMHEQFVEPSKRHADIIIPNGGQNEVAISMLINKIKSIIE
ncbi:uridine kinase [Anaeromicropila herbilytica]|uniref:Uridine kinase n=1 Tax=Anaeromicropila herbilytica TaxID=2785025 RepID=A0A7R7EKW5_9FIRM|nr:uridine kinase [Anaeromicropila herbilytica]BCN30332.1 uridine kinase [Anaeromicropila herbilytica]